MRKIVVTALCCAALFGAADSRLASQNTVDDIRNRSSRKSAEILTRDRERPDAVTSRGAPLLLLAYERNVPVLFDLLLARGAKPDISDAGGRPLVIAAP
jgi:hypothetical protein